MTYGDPNPSTIRRAARLSPMVLLAAAALALGACLPVAGPPSGSATATITPTPGLADLVMQAASFDMQGCPRASCHCVTEYGPLVLHLCIANEGDGAAGPFAIAVNGAAQARSDGVAARATSCIEAGPAEDFRAGSVTVMLDSRDEVAERDETNNAWDSSYPLPVPTPPLLCTATPSPSS